MHCVLVSHFHWDREWYRRSRPTGRDWSTPSTACSTCSRPSPGYHFLLDGQTVLLEDYLAIRPERRPELARWLRARRLAAGPWYVQPDSLLPSGEAHVRNLLYGRRVGEALGPVSRVGYVPDSFGHPAQLPQILAGFGIATFVNWRGNGSEIDELGSPYRWEAPDGSAVEASLLREGYFGAACLPDDVRAAAQGLAELAARLGQGHDGPVLLMNGVDHMLPDAHTGAVAEQLARLTGRHRAARPARARRRPRRRWAAPLARRAARRARRAATARRVVDAHADQARQPALRGAARRLGRAVGGAGTPARRAGRAPGAAARLAAGAAQPSARLDLRLLARRGRRDRAGAIRRRRGPRRADGACGSSSDSPDWAPSAACRGASSRRLPSSTRRRRRAPMSCACRSTPTRRCACRSAARSFPRWCSPRSSTPGFAIDGRPVRVVASDDATRPRWLPGQQPFDVELLAADVPAFGCRRYRLTPCAAVDDVVDDGRVIESGAVRVAVEDGGTLDRALR